MRVVSIGDLVTDYYYKDGKLLGVNGGMTSHNIIANLSCQKVNTAVFGVVGDDDAGKVALKSLSDIKVDVSNIKIKDDINTRCFHVSYFTSDDKLTFTSKKRCPFCNCKKWYDDSLINASDIIEVLNEDDLLVFDNLNFKNQQIIDNTKNKKVIDIGQYFELDNYTECELLNKISNKFDIINLNERVEKYLLNRFNKQNLIDIYELLSPKLIIVTRGKKGADFVFDGRLLKKELLNVSSEVDATGAGDAFFSVFIKEYIKNEFIINDNYINNAFLKATKLTNKVVKKMGARGHINSLYKIKKINSCTCQEFKLNIRKQIKRCNININNLEKRVINALNSNAYDNLSKINFEEMNNIVFVGTGGSFAGANYASKVINNLYGVNAISLYPRDLLYRNTSKVDKVFLLSYSGTTNDLIEGCKNIKLKDIHIITKGERQKIVTKTKISKNNIISYRSAVNKSKERGFLSFEGALAPASLFLKMYLEKTSQTNVIDFITNSFSYWDSYFDNYFKSKKEMLKKILLKGNCFNIFKGDYVESACCDFESKIIESGIFSILVHEKKNFSHGRFINYEHISKKINVYFKQKDVTKYEKELIKYLDNENMIVLESKYNGILCEYDLLVASQFLTYYIANFIDVDMSKPTYSDEAMKIYFYKGEL